MYLAYHRSRSSILNLAFSICVSLTLSACSFEPSISPLQLATAPLQPFQEYSLETPNAPPPVSAPPTPQGGARPFDATTALSMCGQALSWGDEKVGMCLAPGGASYFVWTEDGYAIQVPIDSRDISQAAFREAAEARERAIDDVRDEVRSILGEAIGFGVSLVAFAPACGAILGCAVDIAALAVTGGMLAESGRSIIEDVDKYASSLAQAHYFYCRMRGGSDPTCRKELNGSGPLEGE
jgi:hypothetical protein